MLRSKFLIAATVVAAMMLAACSGSEFRGQEHYYLVTFNKALPFWQNAQSGMFRAGAELGVITEMLGPDGYDPQEQKSELDRVLAEDPPPAGILVAASDVDVLAPSIDNALSRGVNVITLNSDVPDSDRLTFIGVNNYDIGVQLAEVTADRLGNAGTVVMLMTVGQVNQEERLRGYNEVFNQFPAIRVIDTIDIKGDATIAFDQTKAMMEGRQRNAMDAFVCLDNIACAEVAEVLNRNGVHDKVVIGAGASERDLQWVQDGMIQATVAQRPYTMAYTGIRMLADLFKYPPRNMDKESILATVPQFVDTGAILVTQDNVADFIEHQQAASQETGAPAQ